MRYDVIYADPPWSFDNKATGGSHSSGSEQKYSTMTLGEVGDLPIQSIAADNAVLFLWVPTALKFSHGLTVLHRWGFDYKTTVYWDKQRIGMGFWFRNSVEELLVCLKRGGSVAPFKCQVPNIIHVPPEEHSTKPEAFRQLIEKATGHFSRRHCVELFGRKEVPGWTVLGQAVTGQDIRVDGGWNMA